MAPEPFTLHVPDAEIADLRDRLARTRWPDAAPGEPWSAGADVAWVQELVAYWRDGFDWRAAEARLNAFPQFKVPLGGIGLHYLHVPGQGPAPMPLLLSHGWPGSVFEFTDIIPRLTDPARFGGDPADAFTVVAPSLPGYGLSFAPGQRRFGPPEAADLFAGLMTDVLGYRRFGAQGGDWGAFITGSLAHRHPGRMIGVHFNLLSGLVGSALRRDDPVPEEREYLEQLAEWDRDSRAYAVLQGTRPQTPAFALTDSPAGLAAWIAEKFQAWADGGVDAVPRDAMLADIALYWFTGTIGPSFWLYYARQHGALPIPAGATVGVPAGHAVFPREILRPPRVVAERVFTDLRHWTVMERGGHFAALEQPEALARDIQDFFRPLR
ncbi:microsomal epoxide hydrolase [Inquilinus ginsengisoli]|uniref:Microsomal epoxide hydrolase n=1 Tax=Inquilinus ginsengisoli TaxID=363840 RepID=A0ABU1JW70_9PROT|nr:epoxide hydrolase [Inquilinus ginsengisoli]MDR6292869.1 microsomal epoxide hydrolase [Inquilinus ginsengisoli]